MGRKKNFSELQQIAPQRVRELFDEQRDKIYRETDRLFVGLMLFQWILGIVLAFLVSPKTWIGQINQTHAHVWAAIYLGGIITVFPVCLGIFKPGYPITRYVIAVSQMLMSALLIDLTGGRIETHFHVFGSLAFLSFYRDWRVLVPATIIVALDHWLRGVYWPQSVFGVFLTSPWRWVEHTAWVLFEDLFLVMSCRRSAFEMWRIAERTAELEKNQQTIELKVAERTEELVQSKNILATEIAERQRLESVIVQTEKMAAVGQLAAGIAHEINNPVGFISSNMQTLEDYTHKYAKLLSIIEDLKRAVAEKDFDKAHTILGEIREQEQTMNMQFIRSDIGNLLQESKWGVERIKKIVNDLRTFSRADKNVVELIKTEDIIDSILSIVHNELKYKAELKKDYQSKNRVRGNSQQLGQVFINLLINATQAIKERGIIQISTYDQGDFACVDVTDSGEGISPENLKRIFDPFFTTKPVGSGTGLGLSVSYDILKKHQGDIRVKSKVGEGTTFTVMLPIARAEKEALK